jgi:hypothetical protein
MKKFIIVLMFLVTGCTFGHFLTDTSAVRISNQDSVGVWDSTMIFAVQKKVSSTYHWKKMYMWQLRHILNDSLKLTNLMIPRLAGTPTTNITLKTFATNTLYRADFNYNFRKIDSLAIAFNLADFTITGDTVTLKHPLPSQTGNSGKYLTTNGTTTSWGEKLDTTKIPYLAKNNTWTGNNTFPYTQNFLTLVTVGIQNASNGTIDIYNSSNNKYIALSGTATSNRSLLYPDEDGTIATREYMAAKCGSLILTTDSSQITLNTNSSYRSIHHLRSANLSGISATDSTLTIGTSGEYFISVTVTLVNTSSVANSAWMSVCNNNTAIPDATVLFDIRNSYPRTPITITAIESLNANDVLKLKFLTSTYPNDMIYFYNVNFSVHKL